MRVVRVIASSEYDVFIGTGLVDRAGAYIRNAAGGEIAAVITDDVVRGLYLERLLVSLRDHGYTTVHFVVKSGEDSKNAYTYARILEFLAENGLTRTDIIAALGGGVVGDLAGFAAATYMRGIPYIQIPTTMLAAVDSSVGGKTAVNLESGKNLAGAFYQPKAVICDMTVLEMLPPRIFTEGCTEAIKCAMIADKELFNLLHGFPELDLEELVARCVKIKGSIVSEDEFDNGVRKLLNFGHTVGHAIERLSNYDISHGKAVAIGMAVETMAAVRLGICNIESYDSLVGVLHKYGLPYTTRYSAEEISNAALLDKKRDGRKITLVFPEGIGKCVLREAEANDLKKIIARGLTLKHS